MWMSSKHRPLDCSARARLPLIATAETALTMSRMPMVVGSAPSRRLEARCMRAIDPPYQFAEWQFRGLMAQL